MPLNSCMILIYYFFQDLIHEMETRVDELLSAEKNQLSQIEAERISETIDAAMHTLQYKMDHCKRYGYYYMTHHPLHSRIPLSLKFHITIFKVPHRPLQNTTTLFKLTLNSRGKRLFCVEAEARVNSRGKR